MREGGDVEPGVITFRPDNLLTVGLLAAIAYFAAVLLAQGAMRLGWIKAAPPPAAPNPGPVAG